MKSSVVNASSAETPDASLVQSPARALTDACLCLAVRKAARRITQVYEDALAPVGLTAGQFAILGQCCRARGIPIQRLADLLEMDQSSMSRALRPLERDGLVSLNRQSDDGRVRIALATDAGFERFKAALACWHQAQASAADILGLDERAALTAQLNHAIAQFQEHDKA